MYYQHINQFINVLTSLQNILDKAAKYAEEKKFSVDVLLSSRLYPDQFHLLKQIQVACDMVKLGASRLSGKEAPIHDDSEKNLEELKSRVNSVIEYLSSFNENDFSEADNKRIELRLRQGFYLTSSEYLIQFVIPNFYFHVTTAYAILRNNGLEIGKMDFLGKVDFKEIK